MERTITFNTKDRPEFIRELRERVNRYFEENNLSKYADFSMVIKTIVILSLYLVPYFLVVLDVFSNPWLVFAMWMLMAIGMSGIGFSIIHDANHGAYSRNPKINKILGFCINLIGGSAVTWRIQHNVLHHTYTNIYEYDEDIDSGALLRFSFQQKRLKAHRFQQFYAWFLYSLLTVSWTIAKDFVQLARYRSKDLIRTQNISYREALTRIILSKVFYFSFILVIPLVFSSQPWWRTILFYLAMHMVCGLLVSTVFQLAHKISEVSFPLPGVDGSIENHWAVHQFHTTANFANQSRLLSWFVGGLNYQIEHHLFPNVCHVHYPKISGIVKATAEEFQVPYYQHSLWGSIRSHAAFLARLGKCEKA